MPAKPTDAAPEPESSKPKKRSRKSDESKPAKPPRPAKAKKPEPKIVKPDANGKLIVPRQEDPALIEIDGKQVKVTNTHKPFWTDPDIKKGDLIQYYVDVSKWLLPHIAQRPMVMRRYPNGPLGKSFFMKRAPTPRPSWIETCSIEHSSGNVIDFPVISDLASLIWVVNLGCIDLNPWYTRTDDVNRPDYLHFDLDPGDAPWDRVCETARILHTELEERGMPVFAKTSGSKGIHVYVPIVRSLMQKDVWAFAKKLAWEIVEKHPDVATGEYQRKKRPPGRVLIDYNQNRWGSTLASIYSVRPHPKAAVSTPVSWDELEEGIAIESFRIDNVVARLEEKGDLWAPVAPLAPGRFDLTPLVPPADPKKKKSKRREGGRVIPKTGAEAPPSGNMGSSLPGPQPS